jgi:hypothetical protein
MPGGIHDLDFFSGDLSAGTYLLRVFKNDKPAFISRFVIIK